ncbi:MAG: T9SS type A sorting domain-containing protein [Saprospiraceae bacterium]
MIVSNIDTVKTMEGKMIKRFATRSIIGTNGFGHAIFNLAENVGSIAHGFFGSFGPYITQDKQGYFRCFQSSDLNFNILNKDCLLSNIADVNENRIKIYPNPSMDILNIESDFDILDVNIRTVEGTSVYYNKSCPSTIDISHFKSGIYFIEIRDMAHHLISISKLIKL